MLALEAESNLRAALEVWCECAEGGVFEAGAGGVIARSAAPLRSFNNVLVSDDVVDMPGFVKRLVTVFSGSHGRYRLRVRHDVQPTDDAQFERQGLVRRGGIPCLGIALGEYQPATNAPACEIRRVDDVATLADHIGAVAGAFEWEPATLARVFRPALIQDRRWRGYVGYVRGVPVASSQLVVSGAVAGVYYVGVVPAARRAGVGKSMTDRALRDAISVGCTRAALQASPMGLPIYERMGFRKVAYYRQYVPDER